MNKPKRAAVNNTALFQPFFLSGDMHTEYALEFKLKVATDSVRILEKPPDGG